MITDNRCLLVVRHNGLRNCTGILKCIAMTIDSALYFLFEMVKRMAYGLAPALVTQKQIIT